MWIADQFALDASYDQIALGFEAACGAGRVDIMQWLKARFNITRRALRSISAHSKASPMPMSSQALQFACWRGQLPAARWLVAEFGFEWNARAHNECSLADMCGNGFVEAAAWYAETMLAGGIHLTNGPGNRRTSGLVALHAACANGQLVAAQWATGYFKLTDKDVRDN